MILGTLALALFPSGVLAADTIPEFNPLCWKSGACTEARRQINPQSKPGDGWIHESPCVGEWGKCLPSGITETEIAFGGQRRFLHLGDFLQQMYRYAIVIAGLLAVIMLIVAGAQWITSGGNAEAITSAKKRIGGALMGLFLAYMSYFILNAINPALVQFRLPQVWMARPQQLVPTFCSAAPSTTVFAYANDANNQFSKPAIASPNFDLNGLTYSGDPKPSATNKINTDWKGITDPKGPTFYCGSRLYMKDSGQNTCFGDVCVPQPDGEPRICVDLPYDGKPQQKRYYCQDGVLAGTIAGNAGGVTNKVVNTNVFQYPLHLLALCNDGRIEYVAGLKPVGETQPYSYAFGNLKKEYLENFCIGEKNPALAGIAGFYMGLETNDQTALGGGYVEGVLSTGAADWYAVGQGAPGSHDCSFNLSRFVRSLYQTTSPGDCGAGNLECTCGYLSLPQAAETAAQSTEFKSHLISLAELEQGYQCNMDINRSEFPAADNSIKWSGVAITGVHAGEVVAGAAAGYAGCAVITAVAGVATVGVGAIPGAALCAVAVGTYTYFTIPSSKLNSTGFWSFFSDPTSCGDQQAEQDNKVDYSGIIGF